MKVGDEDKSRWLTLLRGVKFFNEFDDEDLDSLLGSGEVAHYKFHDYVVKENDVDFSFFVILKGSVKIIKFGPLRERKEIGSLNSGDCFGEMGLLLRHGRTASILASGECYIFKLNVQDLDSMGLSTQVKLYRKFAEELAEKLKLTTDQIIRPTL